jgi:hypothetical protein
MPYGADRRHPSGFRGACGALLALVMATAATRCGETAPAPEPAPDPPAGAARDAAGADAAPPRGRTLVQSSAREPDLLKGLGYVGGTYDSHPENTGVVLHDAGKAWPGYNLYYSRNKSEAMLLDMAGAPVYRWAYGSDPWQHVTLLPTGGILVLVKDNVLMRLDRDSRLLWEYRARVHHNAWAHDTGDIYVLTREAVRDPAFHSRLMTLDDKIVVLSPQGREKARWSVLEIFRASPYAFLLPAVYEGALDERRAGGRDLDVLHTNHVEAFDGALAGRDRLYERGNLLISLRNINAIAILDGRTREVLWCWGPTNLTFQHHPTLLANGNILVFDNGHASSEVIELEPRSGRIVWQYGPTPGFFSETRGSSQRLPNGNTLITQSDSGYVFEVTPEGEKVWVFANPEIDRKQRRQAIWRMLRFAAGDLPFLPRR